MVKDVQTKVWYKSKTVWVGFLMVIAGVASYIAGEVEIGATLTLSGIVTNTMRIVSSTAVSLKEEI